MKKKNSISNDPERLSGHELVNYLVSNPQAEGNFKWHTLRSSCMWRNLLLQCPQFITFADMEKICHADAVKLLQAHWELFPYFKAGTFSEYEIVTALAIHPELEKFISTENFSGYSWSYLLQHQTHFANQCKWEKLNVTNWCSLLRKCPEFGAHCSFKGFTGSAWSSLLQYQGCFSSQCRWEKLNSWDWIGLLRKKKEFLKDLKLEYIQDAESFRKFLYACYFGECPSPRGMFADPSEEAASYLICKSMDRENGKRFLKKQYEKNNWTFVESLAEISPEEAVDVPGKKYMPFFLALAAPDSVFEKCFQAEKDMALRDPGGNSILLPALIRSLCAGNMKRYDFLISKGLDPDEKNLEGFSCNDTVEYFKNKKRKDKNVR